MQHDGALGEEAGLEDFIAGEGGGAGRVPFGFEFGEIFEGDEAFGGGVEVGDAFGEGAFVKVIVDGGEFPGAIAAGFLFDGGEFTEGLGEVREAVDGTAFGELAVGEEELARTGSKLNDAAGVFEESGELFTERKAVGVIDGGGDDFGEALGAMVG